ncbi:MAG: hypothetical protein WBU20_23100 [Candidatus Acidiferrum sp.]
MAKKTTPTELDSIARAVSQAADSDNVRGLLAPLTPKERKKVWRKCSETLGASRERLRRKIEANAMTPEEKEKLLKLLQL